MLILLRYCNVFILFSSQVMTTLQKVEEEENITAVLHLFLFLFLFSPNDDNSAESRVGM